MKTITADVVEKTWKRMGAISPAEGEGLAAQMYREQPFVQVYLLAVGERDLNVDEAPLLHYLGMVVWQSFVASGQKLTQVDEELLDRAVHANEKMLEYLEGEPDTGFVKVVESVLDGYPQVEVLKYVVEALMEEPEEDCDIREESVGVMFIHLKTVIDCFDQAGESKRPK
jgi:hypothetical protein